MANILSKEKALEILTRHAEGSLGQFVDANGGFDLEAAKNAEKLGIVRKLKWTDTGVEIQLHDPQRAIEMLAKLLGWNEIETVRIEGMENPEFLKWLQTSFQQDKTATAKTEPQRTQRTQRKGGA